VHRLGIAALPTVVDVARAPAARAAHRPGTAIGSSGATRVILDVIAGTIAVEGRPEAPIALVCAQDPLTPGVVAVSVDGTRAIVMTARKAHGDPTLVVVDFTARSIDTVHAFDGRGWLAGGFAGARIVACEQRLGDAPRFTVLVGGKRVWSIDAMVAPCAPVSLGGDVVALLACTHPDALTFTGPSVLCALDLTSGTLAELTHAEGTRLSIEGAAVVVDGGAETVRVALTGPQK
jgi:hypothetical protein